MPNELVPTTSEWTPPQAKWVRRGITGGLALAALMVVAFIINKTVPTLTSAVDLLTKLTGSLINLALTGIALAVIGYVAYSVFSPNGGANKLITMYLNSLSNKLTWAMLDLDPLTPYRERQTEVRAAKARFADAVGRIDGIMERFKQTEAQYRQEAASHERMAKGANAKMAADPKYRNTLEIESRQYQRCLDTANEFKGYYDNLVPLRERFTRTMEAADMVDQNLALDIRIARDKWDAQKAYSEVNKAGRALFRGTEKAALAAQAAELIDMKYADQLGLLNNLATTTEPLLDSIELEKSSATEALLAKWEQDSNKLLAAPTPATASPAAATDGFRKLIQ